MVETERSHRSGSSSSSGSTASDFFFCFSSRSSSSMKISSKSILSPGRSREPALSLSSSLSRRLRSNGSMKGGQASPMFPTGSRKKGGSFEPAEPSSPKVTCIGQVRVKSKRKHGRKLRTRSGRRGEVSFRKTEQPQDGGIHHQQVPQEGLPHRNQRWVHLPLSICETLRGFGSDFNCFVPCGGRSSSSCSWSSSEREKGEKRRGRGRGRGRGSSSCGAVFARWLFALQESEEKGREIEVEEKREEHREIRENGEVVREMEVEILEEKLEMKMEELIEEEEMEEGRESICIPPKNALLLMRSRSAPFRMSSLANRFWDSPAPQDNVEEPEVEEEEEDEELEIHSVLCKENDVQEEALEEEKELHLSVEVDNKEVEMLEMLVSADIVEEQEDSFKEEEEEKNVDIMVNGSSIEPLEEEEEEIKLEVVEEQVKEVVERKDERRVSFSSSTMYLEPEEETEDEASLEEEVVEKLTDEEVSVSVSEEEKEISPRSTAEEQQVNGQEEEEEEEESKERETSLLPECLLLMMCEPKLSMEVSKETWVCSTDFVRFRHSEKKMVQKNAGGDEAIKKKRLSSESNAGQPVKQAIPPQKPRLDKKEKEFQVQPPRSSCSKVEPLVATVEQKLRKAGAYEPFVLKRCKSEPMRNSAKLAPEVCFWNKNKLETTHRPPSVGVGVGAGAGATGIGF